MTVEKKDSSKDDDASSLLESSSSSQHDNVEEELQETIEEEINETSAQASEQEGQADDSPADAPSLSKSWTIASSHVPIFTGGKFVACHLDNQGNEDLPSDGSATEEPREIGATSISCLLLPVGGDIAVVDARKGIKLGSVRGQGNKRNFYNDEEEEEGIDADSITTYALSHNQKILVTCSHNHLIRQYAFQQTTRNDEAAEESQIKVSVQLQKTWGRSGHTLPVTAMEFHISGVFLASGSVDGTVRVWDVRGGYITHIFRPLAGGSGGGSGRLSVTSIRWLRDLSNLLLAIGRDDGSIAIHNLRDKDMKDVIVLRDHLSAVTCMDWWWGSHDNMEERANHSYPAFFITTGRDAVLNVWSINHLNLKSKPSKLEKSKASFDVSSGDLATITYQRKHTIPLYEQVEGMSVVTDGDDNENSLFVATAGSKGKVRIWKSIAREDGSISAPSICAEQPTSQAFGEARGGYLGLHLMQVPSALEASKVSEVSQLVVADAEHSLSFLSLPSGGKQGTLDLERTIVGFNDDVLDLKVIPSTSKGEEASEIVVATNSAQVRIFSLEDFSCDVLDRHEATVLCVDVSPCGRYIATCGKDKKMYVWHRKSRKCVAVAVGHTEAAGATALSRKIGRYDVRGKAAKNGAGAFVVTVSVDRTLKRWNLPGTTDLDTCAESDNSEEISLDAFASARAHEKDINVVAVAPNDSLIATGSQDKTVKLWRSTDLATVATLKGHRRGVWDCQFSPFDRVLATASGDRSIRLWSLGDYTCVRTFQGHMASVLRVRFLNGGLQLMSSGGDGLVKLWTIRSNECEATMDGHSDKVWALDVTPGNKTVISGGGDSQILVWQDTTKEVEDAKSAEREEAILMDQKLANHLRHKEFRQALDIALNLDKPRLTLKVLNSIIETDVKENRSPSTTLKAYVQTWSMDRISQMLQYCREWNTRARNCDVAMLVIQAIVSVFPAEKLAAESGIPEILAGVTPYAERHFDRLDRLYASSYLLDFALYSMGSIDKDDNDDFAAWESQSKLVLPPSHVDGKVQVGGKAVVGHRAGQQAYDEDSDGEVSTVGHSDSSSDEN